MKSIFRAYCSTPPDPYYHAALSTKHLSSYSPVEQVFLVLFLAYLGTAFLQVLSPSLPKRQVNKPKRN